LRGKEGGVASEENGAGFPPCGRCETGWLVPLSDFGGQGAPIHYKAWVCTNPDCGFNLKIRNGEIHIDEPIVHAGEGSGSRRR
jgi:hypothetical protein